MNFLPPSSPGKNKQRFNIAIRGKVWSLFVLNDTMHRMQIPWRPCSFDSQATADDDQVDEKYLAQQDSSKIIIII